MNHAETVDLILDYVEENLDRDLSLDLLASRCALSRYHFHRVFRTLVGEGVTRYVTRRRLARAARELLATRRTVLEIALDAGFGSHEAFTRSFKREFGATPRRFRRERPELPSGPRPRIGELDLALTGGRARPNPRLRREPPLAISGLLYSGRDTRRVYELWRRLFLLEEEAGVARDGRRHFGACLHDLDQRARESFTYCAGIATDDTIGLPSRFLEALETVSIPATTYAVFPHRGPAATLERTFERIYRDWLPATPCTPLLDLDLIALDHRFAGEERDSTFEIWMPVAADWERTCPRLTEA